MLAVCCTAQFMVILDVSIVNVALPSIRAALGFSAIDLQWIVNAYAVTFAGFLMLGGRAADLFGQRRVFITGFLLFAFASLAGGVAQSQGMLIGARALQGLGGAIMAPASLAIINSSFAPGPERLRAIGLWGAMSGAGGAAGVLAGGVITQTLGWRWILLINIPIGIGAALVASAAVAERRREGAGSFDLAGALSITGGLLALVYGIVSAGADSWGSAASARPDRARARAAGGVRRDRGALRHRPAGAAARVLDPPAAHLQPDRAHVQRRAVPDVVLPLALPPARAAHDPDRRRPRVPADGAHDHGLRHARGAPGGALRRRPRARRRASR